jgi:hypothetical protein
LRWILCGFVTCRRRGLRELGTAALQDVYHSLDRECLDAARDAHSCGGALGHSAAAVLGDLIFSNLLSVRSLANASRFA